MTLMLVVATASAVQEAGVAANGSVDKVKGLGFFRHFGTNLNRNKVHRDLLECDYDHPDKSGFCPPVGDSHPFFNNKEVQEE